VQGALTRYRIIAYMVVAGVGPAHGFLFILYVVAAFDLGRRARWPLSRMLLVMIAGTIPFLSFWAERKVTRNWLGDHAEKSDSSTPTVTR
jgi:integral membrane protein